MKPWTLVEVVELYDRVMHRPDDRPEWLRALRDAEHPTCPYYRFLWEVGRRIQREAGPHRRAVALEVGTYVGTSAAHLAAAGPVVVTIDINPDAARQVAMNVTAGRGVMVNAVTGDSRQVLHEMVQGIAEPTTDVAFIDGLHDFEHAYREYRLARELVVDGGLIIFDDAGLDMGGDEMEVTWGLIEDPKIRIDALHPNVGFGVAIKHASTRLRPVEDVAGEALARIKANLAAP